MIHLRYTVINQIKSAATEAEVAEVINDSLQRLKVKKVHGHIIQRFISGMGIDLNREKQIDQHSMRTTENISSAIDIIQSMQKPMDAPNACKLPNAQ